MEILNNANQDQTGSLTSLLLSCSSTSQIYDKNISLDGGQELINSRTKSKWYSPLNDRKGIFYC